MKPLFATIRKLEFEARIFISLLIVLGVCLLCYVPSGRPVSNAVLIGRGLLHSDDIGASAGFAVAAVIMVLASLLRMWAGSVLTSNRVMAFRVQSDAFMTRGPYRIVRNPIYLADLLAMCGFVVCMPPAGILLPILLFVHYVQLVLYEESSLSARFEAEFATYKRRVPRLIPGFRSTWSPRTLAGELEINRDGVRHNALYILFALGCIVSVFTKEFFHAVVIGLPGVLDWAVLHTKIGLPTANSRRPRRVKKVFEDILYAQCWEDPRLDRKAFRINDEDTVFTITSGGCNALTFLLDDPKKIIALDISPYQNFLLELKIGAFRVLEYDELLQFFGVRLSARRMEFYRKIRTTLSEDARGYWDLQEKKIREGIIHCGRFERYMRLLRKWLRRMVGRATIEEFFRTDLSEDRKNLFERKWENLRWRAFTRILLSRTTMSLLFDKAFFKYLEQSFSFGRHFAGRVKHALTVLPVKENYFLSYILLGHYSDEHHLPVYLREENFGRIRDRLDRIELVTNSCQNYFATLSDHSISKFNFTNIFEWMSPKVFEQLLRQTIRVAKNGAILTYRNLLVHRERPESLADEIRQHRSLARAMHEQDLSFIYSNYVVEQITQEPISCRSKSKQPATEEL